jgi:hypothetical protein
MLSPVA